MSFSYTTIEHSSLNCKEVIERLLTFLTFKKSIGNNAYVPDDDYIIKCNNFMIVALCVLQSNRANLYNLRVTQA